MRPEVQEILDKINALVPQVLLDLEAGKDRELEVASESQDSGALTTPHK
jgi:hypothetical protein